MCRMLVSLCHYKTPSLLQGHTFLGATKCVISVTKKKKSRLRLGNLKEKRCKTMTLTHTLRSNKEKTIRINMTYLTKGIIMPRR